jgi:hypothetical protein
MQKTRLKPKLVITLNNSISMRKIQSKNSNKSVVLAKIASPLILKIS